MIYLRCADQHIVVIDPAHIEMLLSGGAVVSKDKEVIVVYTPDAQWTADHLHTALVDNNGVREIIPHKFYELLAEGMKRPEVKR